MPHKRITLDDRLLDGIIKKSEIDAYVPALAAAEKMLADKTDLAAIISAGSTCRPGPPRNSSTR